MKDLSKLKQKETVISFIIENEKYRGILIDYNEFFAYFLELDIWHFNGYMIIPIRKIENIIEEKTDTNIINYLGLLQKKEPLSLILSDSYESLFQFLKKNSNVITIENSIECAVGEITEILDDRVVMDGYYPNCEIIQEGYIVPYDEISIIRLNDEYSSVLRKYIYLE